MIWVLTDVQTNWHYITSEKWRVDAVLAKWKSMNPDIETTLEKKDYFYDGA